MADPMDGALDAVGVPWHRGDRVSLTGGWPGLLPGTVGRVAVAVRRLEGPGSILLVEWEPAGRRAGVPDDLVVRLP